LGRRSPTLEEPGRRTAWSPLAVVCLGTFMLLADVIIVNVALPAMANDLQTPIPI
jgi:hypothetical protein